MDRAAAQHDFFATRDRPPAAPAKLSSSFPKVYRKLNGALMIFRFPCTVFMVYLWIVRAFLRPAACPCTQRMYVAVNCEGVSIIFSSILCRHLSVWDGEVLSAMVRNKVAAVINEVDKPVGQAWKETKLPTTNFISLVSLNY